MVPHCLAAEVELGGDLIRGLAFGEMLEDLVLTYRQPPVETRGAFPVLAARARQAEHPDRLVPGPERHRADLDGALFAGCRDEVDTELAAAPLTAQVLGELRASPSCIFWIDHRREELAD